MDNLVHIDNTIHGEIFGQNFDDVITYLILSRNITPEEAHDIVKEICYEIFDVFEHYHSLEHLLAEFGIPERYIEYFTPLM